MNGFFLNNFNVDPFVLRLEGLRGVFQQNQFSSPIAAGESAEGYVKGNRPWAAGIER